MRTLREMFEKIKRLYKKYEELILYFVSGGITTLVNYAVYFILTDVFEVYYIYSNIAAWAAAVVSAFIINKHVVFHDKYEDFGKLAVQFASFTAFRVASGAAETGILYVCVDLLKWNDLIVKLAASIFVVISNYVFSKLVVFAKRKK